MVIVEVCEAMRAPQVNSAYATTGKAWTAEENQATNEALRNELAGDNSLQPSRDSHQ